MSIEYKTSHWGRHIFTHLGIDWKSVAGHNEGILTKIGEVGVDSGSIAVTIQVRDIGDGVEAVFNCSTPEGDGRYSVLAGKIKGIGRCMVVVFEED